VKQFNAEPISEALESAVSGAPKSLQISEWCIGCGECVRHCKQEALSLREGKAVLNKKKCVLCCYCGAYCKEFCIKVI